MGDEMGGACNADEGDEKCLPNISRIAQGSLPYILEDIGVHGRIILKCILRKWNGCVCVDWIHLAYYRDRWRALVNTVMELLVP
jgi:hypothetical protein